MSFAETESSRIKGRRVNLFMIRYGESPNSYYAYTDGSADVTVDGIAYRARPVTRGAIVVKGNMDKAALEVRMSIDLEVAELFRIYPPSSVVSLTIYQGHLSDGDGEFLVAWAGRITSAKRSHPELVLTCEPIRTSLKRLGLRRHYQYSCSHVLYGEWCRANKAAATSSGTIASISGLRVTMNPGWAVGDPERYLGGMVEWVNSVGDTEVRSIIRIAGDILSLSGALRDLSVGDTLTVVRGCSRDMPGCNSHNNIQNFGGCPFIPTKNPVGRLNHFY